MLPLKPWGSQCLLDGSLCGEDIRMTVLFEGETPLLESLELEECLINALQLNGCRSLTTLLIHEPVSLTFGGLIFFLEQLSLAGSPLSTLEFRSSYIRYPPSTSPSIRIPFPHCRFLSITGGDSAIIALLIRLLVLPKLEQISLHSTHIIPEFEERLFYASSPLFPPPLSPNVNTSVLSIFSNPFTINISLLSRPDGEPHSSFGVELISTDRNAHPEVPTCNQCITLLIANLHLQKVTLIRVKGEPRSLVDLLTTETWMTVFRACPLVTSISIENMGASDNVLVALRDPTQLLVPHLEIIGFRAAEIPRRILAL